VKRHHAIHRSWQDFEHRSATQRRYSALFPLLLALIFQFVGEGIALSTLNLLLAERFGEQIVLGATLVGVATATGILSALRSVIAGAAGPTAGLLSDRAGSLIVGIGSFGLLAVARSLPLVILAVGLSAVSAGAGLATLTAAVGDLAPTQRRGAVIGAYATAGDIGAAAGPFLAYALVAAVPLSWLYLVCALAFCVGLLILHRIR